MTKEEIAKQLAKELWKQPAMTRLDMEFIIKKKLTEILYFDKGSLTKGTIK